MGATLERTHDAVSEKLVGAILIGGQELSVSERIVSILLASLQ